MAIVRPCVGGQELVVALLSYRFPVLATAVVVALVLIAAMTVLAIAVYAQSNGASCASGTVVPDPANNPGLVSDCEALLASRDALAGTVTLNWSADRPISEWEGVGVEGTPERIARLTLRSRELTGEVPTELGNLANLQELYLGQNRLAGEMPTELGNLTNLRILRLSPNPPKEGVGSVS